MLIELLAPDNIWLAASSGVDHDVEVVIHTYEVSWTSVAATPARPRTVGRVRVARTEVCVSSDQHPVMHPN